MTESHNQRLCMDCKEWIDARAPSCYLCGGGETAENAALKRAVETAALNGALATQVGYANAEARADAQFKQAHRVGGSAGMEIANRPVRGVAGYDQLVGRIKSQLKEAGIGE